MKTQLEQLKEYVEYSDTEELKELEQLCIKSLEIIRDKLAEGEDETSREQTTNSI